ncbi:hypothetical protein GCM10011515_21720 [Tsuneonella deserti]|uniref:Uncharacterized protein n=1 Tax=Tsuneonella deserti TaxID=2035528 RepID=A0ABQ1S9T6_9SPHN|nr:hypothetical protein [Tsuneonella deserti]GGE01669.1 hypothetical protein GCM10011515_21720 [Tsuneonella deserti]
MATDSAIETFILDSFSSVWDLELLCTLLDHQEIALTHAQLVERMRSSELVVTQGAQALVASGLAAFVEEGALKFSPVNADAAVCARQACDFYRRFPGRARRLLVSRHSPGLNAFADAFRLRKD